MSSYTLVGTVSVRQILGPQVSEEVVVCTIQTQPTGIVAATLVSQHAFDNGAAGPQLTNFAEAIEEIVSQGKVVGGSGSADLDASGLQEYFVTFEVGYNPPGAPRGTVTVDVPVPVGLLNTEDAELGRVLFGQAEAMIDKAYANLVALAQG